MTLLYSPVGVTYLLIISNQYISQGFNEFTRFSINGSSADPPTVLSRLIFSFYMLNIEQPPKPTKVYSSASHN